MVTVIEDKDELITSAHNGVPTGSSDIERPSYYIKDYQEVNFHRSPSCKPLPENLSEINQDEKMKSSIKGTFYVQIDAIEPKTQFLANNQPIEQTNDNNSLLLTLTDGVITVKGLTIDEIPDLNLNIKPGSKLLLTGVISIEDGLLQLTYENTRFQYGSNTYPRPRSAYRGRGGGSYRPSYEGRRGGNSSTTRYDNDDNDSNFLKRPPPKTTLMDFMPLRKNSNDTKQTIDNDNQKVKERYENKRRNPSEQYHKTNNGVHTTNSNHYYPQSNTNNNYYSEQIIFQTDGTNEQLDPEDDPSHLNYRERRNPLPPRLQRAQEERTRRNTNRYYDESIILSGGELNGTYRNGTANNHSLSSSSSFSRRPDQSTYISNGQQHQATLNFVPHANMLAAVNGSTQPHLAYFQTNTGPLTYNMSGIPNPSFHNQPPSLASSYCYGPPYAAPTYLPATVSNGIDEDSKLFNNQSGTQTKLLIDENENQTTTTTTTTTAIGESQQTDNTTTNDTENQSQALANEQKVVSSSSSSNDGNNTSQQDTTEQNEEKRRDTHSNPRPRWRVNDVCFARWSEDREFYVATIVQIQPPYCTVVFRDYNTYDQVHFGDLKILPRDQQYYPTAQPLVGPSSNLNPLAANVYFPPRTDYYPSTMDGCIMMPEAPPFPFNSSGTLYMCPPMISSISRSNRYHPQDNSSFQPSNRRHENGITNTNTTINSSSSPSKDSNDTSIIDSTTTSVDDNQQQDLPSTTDQIRLCSIADVPLTLVTKDEDRERSTSTESLTSSRYDEQQSINEEEKPDRNSIVNNDS